MYVCMTDIVISARYPCGAAAKEPDIWVTHEGLKNCPEYWNGLNSRVRFHVLNIHVGQGTGVHVAVLNFQAVASSHLVLKDIFHYI